MSKQFPLNVKIIVSLPCYCDETIGISAQANQEFTVKCSKCGSEYKCRSNEYGQIDVITVNISKAAVDGKVMKHTCKMMGIDPEKLKVLNGKAHVDVGRFAEVLTETRKAAEAEVDMFAQIH